MSKKKTFTWSDMKRVVNRIPDDILKHEVVIWTDDEKAYRISEVMKLKEDYVFDGDEACAPKSAMKDCISDAKAMGLTPEELKEEFYLIHPKGSRIIVAE